MSRMKLLLILFLFSISLIGQVKLDTIHFTLYCLENEIFIEENLSEQIDSVYAKYGFNDIDYKTKFEKIIVFGHTDSKGSKKSNQILSQQRAEFVLNSLNRDFNAGEDIALGFGETKPNADNHSEEGRRKNRRVEVTIVYSQVKITKDPLSPKNLYRDTLITFEDGTLLKINLYDYGLIKDCLKYERKTSLLDLFYDLDYNESDYYNYYNFGKVSVKWCNTKCLSSMITLSVKVSDTLVKEYSKEIKQFVKQLKKQNAKFQKHKDNKWYIDVITSCPFEWSYCRFRCGTRGVKLKEKKVRYVVKDGYRIIAASYSHGVMTNFRKINRPKRKIKFKTTCPGSLPNLGIIVIKNNHIDTIYIASGTEKLIEYKRRCLNCKDKNDFERGFLGIKVYKRLLRRKYIFRESNFNEKKFKKVS